MKIIEFTKDKALTLAETVKEELNARQHLQGVGMCNTYGKNPGELLELNLAYAEAKVRYARASRVLNETIEAQSSHAGENK